MNLRMLQHRHFYTYFYNNVANTTVYITDVEIMGYAAAYTESQLKLTANDITAEVTRAKKQRIH